MTTEHTPYDYSTRRGVEPLSWAGFGALARTLAEQVAALEPDVIIGVARGGLLPATAVACALRLDLMPVRLTRRERDVVVRARPEWKVDVGAWAAGRRVVVIDDMASTGETLRLVAARVLESGATSVHTAALCAHTWATPQPDAVARLTDALVLFPWDSEVYAQGQWATHPELAAALSALGGKHP